MAPQKSSRSARRSARILALVLGGVILLAPAQSFPSTVAEESHTPDEHSEAPMDGEPTAGSEGGGVTYRNPEYLAGAAVVRVQTTAEVTVGVDLDGQLRHTVEIPASAATTRTGFFVGPDVVVTSASLIRRRLGVYAVNSVFSDYISVAGEALFEPTRADDPAIDRRLQSCYRWNSSQSECILAIRQSVTVEPYTEGVAAPEVISRRSDSQVTFLVLDCPDRPECSPVSLPLQGGAATGPYVVVAATGEDPLTPKAQGTLTGDHENALSAADAAATHDLLGDAAEGAPIISAQGRAVAMLIRIPGGIAALPGQHLVDDAAKQGVTPRAGSKNHHLYQGLSFLERGEADQARVLLDDVAGSAGQSVIVRLAEQVEPDAAAAPADPGPAASTESAASEWPWQGTVGILLALGVVAVVVTVLVRRARTPAPASPGGPGHGLAFEPVTAPAGSDPPQATGPDLPPPSPHAATGFCTHCGVQLAPGDRYCYSCGTPSHRAGST
jgi:hypothetical protein